MDHDAPLSRAAPSLERHQAAAVGHRRKRQGVERCTVDQSRRSRGKLATDLDPDLVAGFDGEVGTEVTQEGFIGGGRYREDHQAVRFRQLDRVSANRPRAADNGDRGSSGKSECVQSEACCRGIEQQRGRFREGGPARSTYYRSLSHHDLLGVGATVRARRHDVGDDCVAHCQAAVSTASELVDNASNIHAGYVGSGPLRQRGGPSSHPEGEVGGVDRLPRELLFALPRRQAEVRGDRRP